MTSDSVSLETLIKDQKTLISSWQKIAMGNRVVAEDLLKLCNGLKVLEELQKSSSQSARTPVNADFGWRPIQAPEWEESLTGLVFE